MQYKGRLECTTYIPSDQEGSLTSLIENKDFNLAAVDINLR